MEIKESLIQLGLTDTESKIYLALLKLKQATVVMLAKEIEIHRRTIYDNLNILSRKGLVSYKLEKGTKHYQANNPSSFKVFLEEKNNTLKEVLPSLDNLFRQKSSPLQIEVHQGVQAAKSIIEGAFESKEPVYWIGSGLHFLDVLGFSQTFVKEKISKMNIKIIQSETPDLKDKLKIFKGKNTRILPREYETKSGYIVYGDVVALGIINDNEINAIKIKNRDFANTFRNYFNLLWKIAKK